MLGPVARTTSPGPSDVRNERPAAEAIRSQACVLNELLAPPSAGLFFGSGSSDPFKCPCSVLRKLVSGLSLDRASARGIGGLRFTSAEVASLEWYEMKVA